jgi:hypothetical protein
VVAVVVAVLTASVGWAGEIYRWVDEQGVVHFADVPPPNVRGETRNMPDRPTTAAPPPAIAPGESPEAAAGARPAQVVITGQDEEPLGDTRHGVSGTVENKGGAVARDIVIALKVTSPGQGDECLTEEIDVRPSTLGPGEKGEFAVDLDHPCFRGPTQLSLSAQWE